MRKLNLKGLKDEFEVLSRESMQSINGGYDCVFNAMGYLSAYYGGTYSAYDYESSYTGNWDPNGNGVPNSDMISYIGANLTTSSISNGTDIYHHLNGGAGNYIVAAIQVPNSTVGHAVIIQGQNGDGTYYGVDPSNGNAFLSEIDASSIYANSMIGVCGL